MVFQSRQPPTSGAVDLSSVVLRDGTQALTGHWSAGTFRITNLGGPSAAADAATKSYVDTGDAAVLSTVNSTVLFRSGSATLTADWDVGGFKLTNLGAPSSTSDASTKGYVDTAVGAVLRKDGTTALTAAWNVGGFQLKGLTDPTDPQDAATRAWVLANSSGLPGGGTDGAILGYAGGVGAWVAPGTAGQILVSNGTSLASFSSTVTPLTQRVIDSATNTTSTAATITHQLSAGGAAAGIGTRLVFRTERASGVVADSAFIDSVFTTATATPTSELRFSVQLTGTTVRPATVRATGLMLNTGYPLLYEAGAELDVFRFSASVMTYGSTNGTHSSGTTVQSPSGGSLQLIKGTTTYLQIQGGGGLFLGTIGDFVRINATYLQVNAPVHVRDTSTNAVSTALTLGHALTSGSAAAGIGTQLVFTSLSGGGTQVDVAYVAAVLTAVGSGTEVGALAFYTRPSGGAPLERLRIHGAGGVTFGPTAAPTNAGDVGFKSGATLLWRNAGDTAWFTSFQMTTAGTIIIGDPVGGGGGIEVIPGSTTFFGIKSSANYRWLHFGKLSASSGTQTHVQQAPLIQQTGTAGWNALEIAPTIVSEGSGAKRAISYVYSGTERFAVNELGRIVNGNSANEATTASAGSNGDVPAQVVGYLLFQDSNGFVRKIPYYAS